MYGERIKGVSVAEKNKGGEEGERGNHGRRYRVQIQHYENTNVLLNQYHHRIVGGWMRSCGGVGTLSRIPEYTRRNVTTTAVVSRDRERSRERKRQIVVE